MRRAADFKCPTCKVAACRSCEILPSDLGQLFGYHKARCALAYEANGTLLDPRGRR